MAPTQLVPLAVRISRIALFLAPVLILGLFAGCGHRRQSMRPVYGTPVGAPTIVTPVAPSGTITTEPEGGEPILTPIVPSSSNNTDGVTRASGSPPVPPEPEPSLNEGSKSAAPGSSSNSNAPGGIELTRPSAYRSTGRKASVPKPDPQGFAPTGGGPVRRRSFRPLPTPQGRSALEVCRRPPQRERQWWARPDRSRPPQGARLRRLRIPLRDRQRDRIARRPDRGRRAGSTRSMASTAATARTRT